MNQIEIGKFIAKLRTQNNLTQAQLGQKLGVTNKTISRWENGNYMPDVEMLQLLAAEFNVSINDLLSAKKIAADDYRTAAEQNLISALKCDVFTKKERYDFWKKKWLKDNRFFIILFCILTICAIAAAFFMHKTWLMAIICFAAFLIYLKIKNNMLGYIEKKLYL